MPGIGRRPAWSPIRQGSRSSTSWSTGTTPSFSSCSPRRTSTRYTDPNRSTLPDTKTRLVLIGRRRRIPQGAAAEASPGEEPVDLAVSLLPSLEVDGETSTGNIQLSARIRYATRITDATGLVALKDP